MANPYPTREIDSNESVVTAVFRVLRRQPWKTMAARTWDTVSRLFLSALFAISLTVLLATAAQARTYDVMAADVPFQFNIGNRTFRPGHYQLIFADNGLLVLRDSHAHVITSLVTRPIETSGPLPSTKLVFDRRKKHAQLAQIFIENRSQILEVLGEELVVRQSILPPAPSLPVGTFSFSDSQPRLKQ